MKRTLQLHAWPTTLVAAGSLFASGLIPLAPTHAADPYDQKLESRVEALERELNIMEGDKKGKNVETNEVPTFLKAGGAGTKELVISGEVRFRYAYDNLDGQPVGSGANQESRERFRLRLAADYKLSNNFFAGIAIQTGAAADSGNQTYSEGFDNYNIYLWRAFLGWKINDYATVTIGKQANPFYANTELLWDADISPQGVVEQFKFPLSSTFEIAINAGQFLFNDNPENAFRTNSKTIVDGTGATVANPAYVSGANNNTDSYLLEEQIVATWKPTNTLTLTGSAGYFSYLDNGGAGSTTIVNPLPAGAGAGPGTGGTAGSFSSTPGTLLNTGAFNSAAATRKLNLVHSNGDIKFAISPSFKLKVYGDGVYNLQGGGRDIEEYGVLKTSEIQKVAFATGILIGSDYTIKKKGDYTFLAEYRQVGLGSIDPNLNDSDFNLSRLNFRGIKAAVSYGFTPWLIGTVTGFAGNNLGNGKDINIGIANANATQTLQVDLTAKF